MIGGNGKYVHEKSTEPVVKEMATACALAALNEGFDIIVDECTPREEGRSYWPMALGDKYKFVLVYFPEKKRNVDFRMKGDARGYGRLLVRSYWQDVRSLSDS